MQSFKSTSAKTTGTLVNILELFIEQTRFIPAVTACKFTYLKEVVCQSFIVLDKNRSMFFVSSQ